MKTFFYNKIDEGRLQHTLLMEQVVFPVSSEIVLICKVFIQLQRE